VPREQLLTTHRDIVRHLQSGQSIRNAAKLTGKAVSTVQRIKKVAGLNISKG
jgi:transposase